MQKILLFLLFTFQLASAQIEGADSDISIPIYILPTKSDDFEFDLGMQYNVNAISAKYLANEIGMGWDTNTFGVISRNINSIPDDIPITTVVNGVNITDVSEYTSIADEFNFNINGKIGDFKVVRDATGKYLVKYSKTSQLNYIVKFNYSSYATNPSNSGITSFEIIDENGIRYFFDEAEIQEIDYKLNRYSIRMNYLLTNIKDSNDNLLGTITYNNKKVFYSTALTNGDLSLISYELKKVYQITSEGIGKMTLNYDSVSNYIANSTEGNDAYQLNNVEVLDAFGNKVKKIAFEYATLQNAKLSPRRILTSINEYGFNKLTNVYEGPISTQFTYNTGIDTSNARIDQFGYTDFSKACDYLDIYNPEQNQYYVVNPYGKDYGALKEIIYPSKKRVQYLFETNTFSKIINYNLDATTFFRFKNINNFSFTQIGDFVFDTSVSNNANSKNGAQFEILENRVYFLKINPSILTLNPNGVLNAQDFWTINSDRTDDWGVYIIDSNNLSLCYYLNSQQLSYAECNKGIPIKLAPGTYTFRITRGASVARVAGFLTLFETVQSSGFSQYSYSAGLRIKNISVFKNNETIASKSNTYSYNLFQDDLTSSGVLMPENEEVLTNSIYKIANVFYTNIKITDDISGTSTEMVYEAPERKVLDDKDYSYIYKDGFLKESHIKKNNILYQSTINEYQLKTASMPTNANYPTFLAEPITEYLLVKTTTKSFEPNLKEEVESFDYDLSNLKLKQTTKTHDITASLKEATTKIFDYETTIKAKTNAIVLKSEKELLNSTLLWTKTYNYKNITDAFPNYKIALTNTTMAKGTGTGQSMVRVVSYDADNIHPIEIISGEKVSTLLVWGYNKTQLVLTIENYVATDYALVGTLISALQNFSNANDEANMITTMRAIQTKVPTKMVTGITYKPLIGVSKTLDERGNVTTNEYDVFGRLKRIVDFEGNLLKEYQYNYIQQ